MGSSQMYEMFVFRLIGLIPTLCLMLVGLILAVRNLPRYPRPCWALIAALALAGFNNLVLPVMMQTLMETFGSGSFSDNRGVMIILTTLPYSIVGALSWALIFFAVLDRPPQPKFLKEDERDLSETHGR